MLGEVRHASAFHLYYTITQKPIGGQRQGDTSEHYPAVPIVDEFVQSVGDECHADSANIVNNAGVVYFGLRGNTNVVRVRGPALADGNAGNPGVVIAHHEAVASCIVKARVAKCFMSASKGFS